MGPSPLSLSLSLFLFFHTLLTHSIPRTNIDISLLKQQTTLLLFLMILLCTLKFSEKNFFINKEVSSFFGLHSFIVLLLVVFFCFCFFSSTMVEDFQYCVYIIYNKYKIYN